MKQSDFNRAKELEVSIGFHERQIQEIEGYLASSNLYISLQVLDRSERYASERTIPVSKVTLMSMLKDYLEDLKLKKANLKMELGKLVEPEPPPPRKSSFFFSKGGNG